LKEYRKPQSDQGSANQAPHDGCYPAGAHFLHPVQRYFGQPESEAVIYSIKRENVQT
jgi:hypothetical protein